MGDFWDQGLACLHLKPLFPCLIRLFQLRLAIDIDAQFSRDDKSDLESVSAMSFVRRHLIP